jgi:hypothetical protein
MTPSHCDENVLRGYSHDTHNRRRDLARAEPG